ncbi:MAG: hypothetical protein PHR35_06740 [Kiritimatiellae bacterium]|nr:hypothetical protein [Kiritimatiellia bacterium]
MSEDCANDRNLRLPRFAWVGVDWSCAPVVAAACWRTPAGWRLADLPGDAWREARRDGRRCCAALPMEHIFAERLEPPARTRGRAARLAPGMLDLRLPVPVESCAVTFVPEADGRALMAYAMPREKLAAALEAHSAAGCPSERAVPAAHALWSRLVRTRPPAPDRLQLLLHAAPGAWTLMAGHGAALQSCLTLSSGDAAAVGRAARVFSQRRQTAQAGLLVCGAADEACLAALRAQPSLAEMEVAGADDAPRFLARALAEEGAHAFGCETGNLRVGAHIHPLAMAKRVRREWLAIATMLLTAVLLLAAHGLLWWRAAQTRRSLDARLTAQASLLAGRALPQRGAAAIELAHRELETRLHPQVEALGETTAMTLLPRLLRVAALRGLTFSSMAAEEQRLEVAGAAAGESDVAAWREAACEAGLVPAIACEAGRNGGVVFHGTLMVREALP